MQCGFARIRRPQQRNLRGTLRPDRMRWTLALCALLWPGELLGEILDTALDVRLEVIGSLVFRNGAQHLLETIEPLLRLARLAIRLLGLPVFR